MSGYCANSGLRHCTKAKFLFDAPTGKLQSMHFIVFSSLVLTCDLLVLILQLTEQKGCALRNIFSRKCKCNSDIISFTRISLMWSCDVIDA